MFSVGQQKTCAAICSPFPMHRAPNGNLVYEPISPLWHRARMSMSTPTNWNSFEVHADGMEVGEARSKVAAQCLAHKSPPTFLFFLDYDVIVPMDALTKLFMRACCFPKYDVYTGVYCLKRAHQPEPLIYGEPGQGPLWDWAVGDLLTTEKHGVLATHMGLTLIRTSLFRKMLDAGVVHGDGTDMDDEPFFKTVNEGRTLKNGAMILQMGTEDIYFFEKAKRIPGGCKIMVDTSVLGGHHDRHGGVTYGLPMDYGPVAKAAWLKDPKTGESKDKADGLKLALDLGAGDDRRQWPGHVTYTTDMRPDAHPDYVMDTRLLNFPADHWDKVASSHHLEHLGRWDQEQVWAEMFRVTKPGGACEHIVPSLDWACFKVKEGNIDEHVYNVLYGAQESHGYEREFNTHYFGYTKAVARALAEGAGYVDVVVHDWRDFENLKYNLVITGKKPLPEEDCDGHEVAKMIDEGCPNEPAP